VDDVVKGAVMADRRDNNILVVAPSGTSTFDRDILDRLGHDVTICDGPGPDQPCPLLAHGDCPLFDDAHGIAFELDLDQATHREVLGRYGELAPLDRPIRVVVRPGQAERHGALLDRFEVWTSEPTVAELDGFAAEVEAADRLG
jgi:hypothetical protein